MITNSNLPIISDQYTDPKDNKNKIRFYNYSSVNTYRTTFDFPSINHQHNFLDILNIPVCLSDFIDDNCNSSSSSSSGITFDSELQKQEIINLLNYPQIQTINNTLTPDTNKNINIIEQDGGGVYPTYNILSVSEGEIYFDFTNLINYLNEFESYYQERSEFYNNLVNDNIRYINGTLVEDNILQFISLDGYLEFSSIDIYVPEIRDIQAYSLTSKVNILDNYLNGFVPGVYKILNPSRMNSGFNTTTYITNFDFVSIITSSTNFQLEFTFPNDVEEGTIGYFFFYYMMSNSSSTDDNPFNLIIKMVNLLPLQLTTDTLTFTPYPDSYNQAGTMNLFTYQLDRYYAPGETLNISLERQHKPNPAPNNLATLIIPVFGIYYLSSGNREWVP